MRKQPEVVLPYSMGAVSGPGFSPAGSPLKGGCEVDGHLLRLISGTNGDDN
jgi:hypothetical protein